MNTNKFLFNIPEYIETICNTLVEFDPHIVGGAVRDMVLGREVLEYDLTSSARPEEVHGLFERCIDTGKDFGTVTVVVGEEKHTCEITTFRSESGYSDSRRPDDVEYGDSIEEDVKRRDFTINALAYNPITDRLVDEFDGQGDLERKVIRCIGDPTTRFEEDTLRLFRACRFAGQLDFDMDVETLAAVTALAGSAPLPAVERIQVELSKLLLSESRKGLDYFVSSGLAQRLFPELRLDVDLIMTAPETVRWARFLSSASDVQAVMDRLRFSRKEYKWILRLIERDFDPKKAAFEVTDLAISGGELHQMGYSGEAIGVIQKRLLEAVLSGSHENTKAALMPLVS